MSDHKQAAQNYVTLMVDDFVHVKRYGGNFNLLRYLTKRVGVVNQVLLLFAAIEVVRHFMAGEPVPM